MLYFAELFGRRVTSSDRATVGKLTDFLFLATDQPLITKIVMNGGSHPTIVPIASVKTVNGSIVLAPGYQTVEPAVNELYLRKNLLDQQILDIKGNKVVRVNDVVIQEKPYYVIAGVDVGLLGIARWFKLEQFINKNMAIFGRAVHSDFLPWDDIQPLELSRGKVVVKREETKLTKLPPEDLADHLERLSVKNINKILNLLPNEYEVEVIQNLNATNQNALFRVLKPERAAKILTLLDLDDAADILLALPSKRREAILPFLPEERRNEIDYLLTLSTTDIGDLVTTAVFTATPEETVSSVRRRIKSATADFSWLSYVYVLNKKSELVGVFNLHELLIQEADNAVYKFMIPNVISLHLTTPPEIAMKRMIKYRINALPVVDDRHRLIGIVTFDDIMKRFQYKLT